MLGRRPIKSKLLQQQQNKYHQKLQQRQQFTCQIVQSTLAITQSLQQQLEVQDNYQDIQQLPIDQIDQLVDFKMNLFISGIVGNSVRKRLCQQVQNILVQHRTYQQYQYCQEVQKQLQTLTQTQTKSITKEQQLIQQLSLTTPHILFHINTFTLPLINQLQQLTKQNNNLQIQNKQQNKIIYQNKKQLIKIKNKYVQLNKQYSQYKCQVKKSQLTLQRQIQRLQKLIRQYRQRVDVLQTQICDKQQQLLIIKQQYQQRIQSLHLDYNTVYELQSKLFIQEINQQLLQLSIHHTQQKQSTLFKQRNNYYCRNNYKQVQNCIIQTINKQIVFVENKHKDYQLQMQRCKQIIKNLTQFIKQINQLNKYQYKSLKKDDINNYNNKLTINNIDQKEQSNCQQNNSDLHQDMLSSSSFKQIKQINELISSTIKTILLQKSKKNKLLQQQVILLQQQCLLEKQKVQQLVQYISKNSSNNGIKQVNVIINQGNNNKNDNNNINQQNSLSDNDQISIVENSPIDRLQKEQQSIIKKSQIDSIQQQQKQNQVNQFIIIENNQNIDKNQNLTSKHIKKQTSSTTKTFNLIQQILILRQQNHKLIKQISILKKQENYKNIERQQNQKQQKQQKQTKLMGKIKKLSIDNQNVTTNNNNYNGNKQKQHTIIDQCNNQQQQIIKTIKGQQITKLQQQNSQQKVKRLQKKINQYKQNIINLNEIINYMINHLRGYQCGRLFNNSNNGKNNNNNKTDKQNSYKTDNNSKRQFTGNNSSDDNNNLPVRKYSHLYEQINLSNKQNTSNNLSINSFSSTINRQTNFNKTHKQIGKIGKIANLNNDKQNNSSSLIFENNYDRNRYSTSRTKPRVIHNNQLSFSNGNGNNNQDKIKTSLLSKQVLKQKYQNFQFIRKLCIKEKKCKQLLTKFHTYLDFYINQISRIQMMIQEQQSVPNDLNNNNETWQNMSQQESSISYPYYLKTNYSKKFIDTNKEVEKSLQYNSFYNYTDRSQSRRRIQTFSIR